MAESSRFQANAVASSPLEYAISPQTVRGLRFKSLDSRNLRLRTKRTVDKDVYKVTGLFVLPKWHFLLHTQCTIGSEISVQQESSGRIIAHAIDNKSAEIGIRTI